MRSLIESLEAFTQGLAEAKADLKSQAVVLMGLPAAGKSTFVNNELSRYLPNFSAPRVENSDVQVKRTQHAYADDVFKKLKKAKTAREYEKAVAEIAYPDNDKKFHRIGLSFDEFSRVKNPGDLFKREYKNFFASWFDMRDVAKARTAAMFKDKVTKSGDGLVIDTVASDPQKILKKLGATKEAGMTNTIFYLEIDPTLSIVRDKYRGATEGRSVGEGVIMNYATQMKGAYDAYVKDLNKPDGVVDRLYHFRWKPAGADPVKGTWTKVAEHKGDIKRELAKRKVEA